MLLLTGNFFIMVNFIVYAHGRNESIDISNKIGVVVKA